MEWLEWTFADATASWDEAERVTGRHRLDPRIFRNRMVMVISGLDLNFDPSLPLGRGGRGRGRLRP